MGWRPSHCLPPNLEWLKVGLFIASQFLQYVSCYMCVRGESCAGEQGLERGGETEWGQMQCCAFWVLTERVFRRRFPSS